MWEAVKEDVHFLFRLSEYTKQNRRRKSMMSVSSSKGKKTTGPHPAFYKSISNNNSSS